MSLTKEYIDEVMDNLAFFKNSKRPCQINLASGQELIHNISQINKKRGQNKNVFDRTFLIDKTKLKPTALFPHRY